MSPALRDLAELVRLPAAVTVPGDTLVGLAAGGGPARGRAWLLPVSSVCLYWAGMALNDWGDRDLDALERPERPLPSGRVRPQEALALAGGLSAAGVAVAAVAGGRRAAGVAGLLAAAVWTYDLAGKRGPLAPLSMAATRALDVLLGATASHGGAARGLVPAVVVGVHTLGVTDLSRDEVHGARGAAPVRAQAATAAATLGTLAAAAATAVAPAPTASAAAAARPATAARAAVPALVPALASAAATAAYATRVLPAQRAAGDGEATSARAATMTGLKALVLLQAGLLAGLGRPLQALGVLGLGRTGRLLARFGSPT